MQNRDYAMLGAILYAFSGFTVYNIFFNHFVDVVAIFPLLLIGLCLLYTSHRAGGGGRGGGAGDRQDPQGVG